jgi:hypothetical protein
MFEFIIVFIIFVVALNITANRTECRKYNAMTTEEKTLYQLELNNQNTNSIFWLIAAGPIGSLLGFISVFAFIYYIFM